MKNAVHLKKTPLINLLHSSIGLVFTCYGMDTTIINGLHLFKVASYSLSKGLGYGKYISSDSFEIGGHSWEVRFYPDGKREDDNATYVSVFVVLASEGPAKALFELTLLDQSGQENHMVKASFEAYTLVTEGSTWGYKRFIKRTVLEASDYVRDDCLQISCRVGAVQSQTDETFLQSRCCSMSEMIALKD